MLTPLAPYVAPYKPLNNITPFTYRDGLTYLEKLEDLGTWFNDTIVPYINENFTGLGDEFETQVNLLITQVNDQLTAQDIAFGAQLEELTGAEATINDIVVETIIANVASATRILLDSIYAPKVSTADSIDDIEAVLAGRLSDAQLEVKYVLASTYTTAINTLNTLVTSGRLSDASLIAQFALKSIENIVSSGRLSNASLEGQFVLLTTYNTAINTLNTLVTSGRLSNASLIAQFPEIATYTPIETFATVAALQAATRSNGSVARASNLLMVTFVRISGAWVMVGTAKFADLAAYTASGITPAAGMIRRLASLSYDEEYTGSAWFEYGTFGGTVFGDSANVAKTTLTLTAPWVFFGAPYDTPFYRKDKGLVTLGGLMKSGAAAGVIATLPVGCRPLATRYFIVVANAGALTASITIASTGVMTLAAFGTSATNVFVSLDQISFMAEA